MDPETAQRAVDLLLDGADAHAGVVVGFMGGEPLIHRALLHDTARYAAAQGAYLGIPVRFSITTNGTLLTDADARLFSELDWTVQISIDGKPEFHDRQRPSHSGVSAYARVLRALERIDRVGRPRTLSARSTIAHGWTSLPEQLDHLIGLGFDDVGFSPVLSSSAPNWALNASDLRRFLAEMIECGRTAIAHWTQSRPYPFSNLLTALEHIHKGTHQPYPCGAAAGYLSVSAQGNLYACHRFVNDNRFQMGDLDRGLNDESRRRFLLSRHVDYQQPCASCWARYLCGGGCHHEVLHVGRPACDYVRGWLEFCLQAYVELDNASFFSERLHET
jgi:uncharacterized protein